MSKEKGIVQSEHGVIKILPRYDGEQTCRVVMPEDMTALDMGMGCEHLMSVIASSMDSGYEKALENLCEGAMRWRMRRRM